MTTLTAPARPQLSSPRRSKLAWAAADSLAVAQRNIIAMTRRPQLLGSGRAAQAAGSVLEAIGRAQDAIIEVARSTAQMW